MEDISTLIWIGVGILWFVTRIIRSSAKKARRSQKKPPRPTASFPNTSQPETPSTQVDSKRRFTISGRHGSGPPPIVPR